MDFRMGGGSSREQEDFTRAVANEGVIGINVGES